jgi:hypothetical protein
VGWQTVAAHLLLRLLPLALKITSFSVCGCCSSPPGAIISSPNAIARSGAKTLLLFTGETPVASWYLMLQQGLEGEARRDRAMCGGRRGSMSVIGMLRQHCSPGVNCHQMWQQSTPTFVRTLVGLALFWLPFYRLCGFAFYHQFGWSRATRIIRYPAWLRSTR